MTLYQRLCAAGFGDRLDHHESDLYVPVTNETTRILNEWLGDHGYGECFCEKFVDQTTENLMYDVAFQYDPWWELHTDH